MDIKTCRPAILPVKQLYLEQILPELGKAREALARYDEVVSHEIYAKTLLKPMRWLEAIASLHPHSTKSLFQEVFGLHTHSVSQERAALIQRICDDKKGLDAAIRLGERHKLGAAFFCHLHKIIKKRDSAHPQEVGKLRSLQNWIGPKGCTIQEAYFYPPKPARVVPLMRNLDLYLSALEIDPLLQIAIAFAQFLIIHPFMDGNGRLARILVPVFCKKIKLTSNASLFMSAHFAKDRLEYFHKLFLISEKKAWEEWIIYFLQGVTQESIRLKDCFLKLQKLHHHLVEESSELIAKRLFENPLVKRKQTKIDRHLLKKKLLAPYGEELCIFQPLISTVEKFS